MKELLSLFLILPLLAGNAESKCKQKQEDSLAVVLQSTSDSARIPVLLKLCWALRNAAPEKSVQYGMEAIDLADRYDDYDNLAKAYSFVGVANRIMGKYSESIDFYYKGLDVAEKHNIPEQAGYAHLNLANLYIYQEHTALAFENINKVEIIAKETGNKQMLAYMYLFDGRTHNLEGNIDTALASYQKSLSIRQDLNQIPEQATCYKYIGDVYFQKGSYLTAIDNYNKSLAKVDKQNDKDLYANILIKKALILAKENKLHEASVLAHESLGIASEIGANMTVRDALQVLTTISLLTHDYKSASIYQQRVIQYNDTLFNQKLSEKIFSLEYQLERQQRMIKIDLLNKDNAIKELRIKRIRLISIALISLVGLLALVFSASLVLLRQRGVRERLLESQNREIIGQRNSIEQQNRQLIDANERLAKSEEDLMRMVQTKDKLFSIIAHDLRNPFTALTGLTEVLQRSAGSIDPKEIAELATLINESSHKLLSLIENLLQWTKSQTGRLNLIAKDIQLKNLTDEILRIYLTQSDSKGIKLKNDIADNVTVFADSETLSVIIRNLVSNGIKYTEPGGNVTLTAFQKHETTVLKVTDTGVGMGADTLSRLFKIEGGLTTEGTSHEAGTGLGLIICKEFVECNGGTIAIESSTGKGTTFTVSLPAVKPIQVS